MHRLACLVFILLLNTPALAWNAAGHMISGAIAYEILKKDDPAALAQVLDAIRQHPEYGKFFAPKLEAVPADGRDQYLFMLAARWPDDARRSKYHHGPWHYVNFDISAAERVAPAGENIITAYKKNLAIVKGDAPPAEKGVAVCWLFHLIGDIHQPLHVAAQYGDDYPDGDRGGNLVLVRPKAGRAILNLHSLWDGLLLGTGRFTDAKNVAAKLRLRPDLAKQKLTELAEPSFERWAKIESFEIAKRDVYLDGKPLGSPKRDDDTPAVPDGYLDNAKAIAERRIVLAGYRLADALKQSMAQ